MLGDSPGSHRALLSLGLRELGGRGGGGIQTPGAAAVPGEARGGLVACLCDLEAAWALARALLEGEGGDRGNSRAVAERSQGI